MLSQKDIAKQLQERYQMNEAIWFSSHKQGFPWNFTLRKIVGLCLLAPLAVLFFPGGRQILFEEKFGAIILAVSALSMVAYLLTSHFINVFKNPLCESGLYGKDLNKAGSKEDKEKIPEALGVVPAIFFLLITIVEQVISREITKGKLVEYNAALLSICLVVLLGVLDDILNLQWRHKLIVPTIASIPLLVAYNGLTSVVVPIPFRSFMGPMVNLGLMYYFYMGNISIFCTNSINIYAGINGLEVGQSFVIGCFILIHNIIELKLNSSEDNFQNHLFSMTIMMPFLATSLALLKNNQFPAKVFIGDSYCYFAGMTFAVCGILGHFSKTMMLFFIPQLLNFALSLPQLFGVVHCPRHRLPKFNSDTYKLECVHNHYNLLNAFLRFVGPTNESQTCNVLLLIQTITCVIGLFIRYVIADFVF